MCGRYNFSSDQLKELRMILADADRVKTGDVHPHDRAVVITKAENDERMKTRFLAAEVMRWGFPLKSRLIINARSETVTGRKMFRDSIFRRRCVIPAGSFYEWDARKNKFTFMNEDQSSLYMGGFYDLYQNEKRFVILTTKAGESVAKVHERMPLLLRKTELASWLHDDVFLEEALQTVPQELARVRENEQLALF